MQLIFERAPCMIIHTSYTQGKDTQRRAVLTYKVGKARMAPRPGMQVAFPTTTVPPPPLLTTWVFAGACCKPGAGLLW